jgi:hypothetical protein
VGPARQRLVELGGYPFGLRWYWAGAAGPKVTPRPFFLFSDFLFFFFILFFVLFKSFAILDSNQIKQDPSLF